MNIQVLVATMNQKDHNILNKLNIQSDAIVINQCNKDDYEEFNYNSHKIKFVSNSNKGLSKSRNEAISYATNDICVIADDDLVYCENYSNIIADKYTAYNNYDIIVFQVEGIERKFKSYYPKQRKLNFFTCMKVSSVEITFKLKSIKNNNISFNNDFGSGSKYKMGEENIFLCNCLKKGLKILYIPLKIADLHTTDSTWFSDYNDKYFFDRGAIYAAINRNISPLLIVLFSLKHFSICTSTMSYFKALYLMLLGRKHYLKEKS